MSKVLYCAGILTAASISAAVAADLPSRIYTKAPPANATFDWSGGYIGIAGGFGGGHSNQSDGPPGNLGGGGGGGGGVGDGSYSLSGGLIGGTLGHNWRSGRWVYGFEGDYSWADISGNSGACGLSTGQPPHACGTKLNSLGTLRGRLGYAAGATGNWLLYATAGGAVGDVHGWDALTPASGSELRAGWTVGAGVETPFAPNWTAKLEYLYVDLGKAKLFDILPAQPETVSFNANIVRAGINYRLPPGNAAATRASWEAPFNWTGFYLGGHAGGGSARSNWAAQQDANWWTDSVTGAFPFPSNTGALGGVQTGFNYQLGWVVAGIEGTWSGANLKTTIPSPYYPESDSQTTKVSNLFTVAGRLGITWDRVLFYGKGGWAGGDVELSAFSTVGPTSWNPGSKFRSGVIVGGGVEYQITPNWIVGLEYNHIDLGRSSYGANSTSSGGSTDFFAVDDKTKIDTVVGRVSYKLDGIPFATR